VSRPWIEKNHQGLALELVAATLDTVLIARAIREPDSPTWMALATRIRKRMDFSLRKNLPWPGPLPKLGSWVVMGWPMEEQEQLERAKASGSRTNLLSLVNAEPTPVVAVAPRLLKPPAQQSLSRAAGFERPADSSIRKPPAWNPAQLIASEVGAVLFRRPHRAVLSRSPFMLPCLSNETPRPSMVFRRAVSRLDQPWRRALDFQQPC